MERRGKGAETSGLYLWLHAVRTAHQLFFGFSACKTKSEEETRKESKWDLENLEDGKQSFHFFFDKFICFLLQVLTRRAIQHIHTFIAFFKEGGWVLSAGRYTKSVSHAIG